MEWLALAVLLGIALAVAVLAWVGALSLFRGTPVHRVRGEAGREPPEPAAAEFPAGVELLAGAALHPGNRVELLRNGDGTFPRLWEELRSARESILFQNYYAESGKVAETTVEILSERARAGVRVRFLYDPVGFRGLAAPALERLREAGVEVHPLRPLRLRALHRANHRAHSRIVVVDGAVGYTGGFGLSDRWLGDGRHAGEWRDTNVRVTGPAVAPMEAAFASLRAEATGELFVPAPLPRPSADGPHRAAFFHSSPGVGSTTAERLLALTVAGARRSVHVWSGYFAPEDGLVQLLAAAARRGVEVRVLTATGEHTDIPVALWAGRARYPELLEAGVRIHEYRPAMMHAKSFVVDGVWCAVGAINFDNRSLALNDESALLVWNGSVGAELEADFREDLRHADEILPEAFRGRGWGERARETAAAWLLRLL